MLRNYFSITCAALKKQPGFSAVKILSLGIGLACSILVLMHLQYAVSFDRHFPNADNIYRLVTDFDSGGQHVSAMVSSAAYKGQLRQDYPEIRNIAVVQAGYGLFSRGDVASGNAMTWADPELIELFSLEFLRGDARTALATPNSVVLMESAAEKYFGDEDPMGQILTFDEQADLEVTGVIRDLPQTTHFDLQMLVSIETGRQLYGPNYISGSSWLPGAGIVTYVSFANREDATRVAADLDNFLTRHLPQQSGVNSISSLELGLEPLEEIYLSDRSNYGGFNPRTEVFGYSDNPRAQVLAGLGLFALLILLTSAVNYASLSLAQNQQRGKEIGVRKTMGARRGEIISQFLFESVALSFAAVFIALPLAYLAIPVYTGFTGTGFSFTDALRPGPVAVLPLFVVATGILSGLIPALVLSRVKAALAVKSKLPQTRGSRLGRSLVTVVQFTLSTTLIMFSVAVVLQVRYLNDMNIGFNKDNLVVFDSTFNYFEPDNFDFGILTNELEQHPGVLAVGVSNMPLPYAGAGTDWRLADAPPGEAQKVVSAIVNDSFIASLQLDLLAGRNFSREFPSEFRSQVASSRFPAQREPGLKAVVITRSTAARFGFTTPQAALDQILLSGSTFQYRVIGVVEDFHPSGALEDPATSPGILYASLDPMTYLFVRVDPGQMESALRHIDTVWARHRPGVPIGRTFYDQTFAGMVAEQTGSISKAATFASVVTVLISAFGIYALAYYSGQRRTREVGIRKVLGATSTSIMLLMTWDLLKPALVAALLAFDTSDQMIAAWFQQFSSRVEISPLLYLALAFATLLLVVLTTIFQTAKAANTKPAESLRYE